MPKIELSVDEKLLLNIAVGIASLTDILYAVTDDEVAQKYEESIDAMKNEYDLIWDRLGKTGQSFLQEKLS